MKKYLLSLLIVWLTFISFSNADSLSLSCSDWNCTPWNISFSQWDIINSYEDWFNGQCTIKLNWLFSFIDNNSNDYSCSSVIFNDGWIECNWDLYPSLPFTITNSSSLSFDYYYCSNDLTPNSVFSYTPTSSWWWDWWEWWNTWWWIISWWIITLTPVVSWLNSLVVEIFPYLLYIGLWIIVVIVWFVAIRWLINWTQAKLRGTFSSWRKRR